MGVILDNHLAYTLLFLVSIYLIRVKDTGSGVLIGEIYKYERKPLNNEALQSILKPL